MILNYMRLSNDLCNLLLSSYKHEVMWASIGQSHIWEIQKQKLLHIIIYKDMEFDEYISTQCKKEGKKFCALQRICKI